MCNFTEDEKTRLKEVTEVAASIPLIDALEDYIVESIFSYAKGLPVVDPFTNIRSKKLYDVVDNTNNIGWSVKGIQKKFRPNSSLELVIQRADIFKKHQALGYDVLDKDTSPAILGEAILKHWHQKINGDATSQEVTSKRVFILLKWPNNLHYGVIEEDIKIFRNDELTWTWSSPDKDGLHGKRNSDGVCIYKWYPNQKQLFETFIIPENIYTYDITLSRISMDTLIRNILPLR